MATTWIDIGVIRVQRYLSRTDRLVGRRAGSALVTDTMRSADVIAHTQEVFGDLGIASHSDGGEADGVLHLRLNRSIGDDVARNIAQFVLRQLRTRMPAAEFEAVWADGDTYSAAAPEMAKRLGTRQSLRWYPAITASPFARRCELTGTDTATSTRRVARVERSVGDDTAARLDHEERRRASGHTRGAHDRLERVGHLEPARDLNAVAASIADDADPSIQRGANHLATIFIDGNAMGSFFTTVVTTPGADKDALSAAATTATLDAVSTALDNLVQQTSGPSGAAPFEVHVLGGDDVLLTVPAPFGLTTARDIISGFTDRMADAVASHAPSLSGMAPTASAGVVIAHQSYPIATVIDIATDLLSMAKRATSGRRASLAWTDITRYGHRIDDRRPLELDEMTSLGDDVTLIRELGRSARTILAAAAVHPVPEVARARALVEFHRRGRPDLAHLADDPTRLNTLIDLARWWY